ncbi:hydrolase 1, exosortase A system-associated [Novosphingobium sp.]|uniref:hydrolase 1, exosortase A system-associated n=1 Tax=Novosphingobium sp. TaxID=1874826 RepID=UPI00352B9149
MNRLHLTFPCEGAALAGTLDMAAATATTGLLIVSGGNEIRAGAWAGQAQLAARLARHGVPVFRFDRRGVGDSEGANGGFRSSRDDLVAALAAFRKAAPQVRRVVAFGNCDAAAALLLHHAGLGIDALVLANPWTIDGEEAPAAMPAAAIRQRYLAKLKNPREVLRLLTGGVNLAKLFRGLRSAAAPAAAPSSLVDALRAGADAFAGPLTILIASGDRTAQLFEAAWPKDDARVQRIASASHSFSDDAAREWLFARLLDVLD